MLIANPIYDIIFKYLMENATIAKYIISAITNIEILSLKIQPQEIVTHVEGNITIFRIDFKAVIKTKKGNLETVLIELQKSKKGYTSLRFRRYVGENYSKEDVVLNENDNTEKKVTLPLTALYFLNFYLKNVKTPVLKVKTVYQNGITGENLDPNITEDFVELLTHNLYVIQIPRLKKIPISEMEQILDVFNQRKYKTDDPHVLNYTGDTSNPKVAAIADRLAAAMGDEKLRRELQAQDEVEREFEIHRKKAEKWMDKYQKAQLAMIDIEKAKIEAEKTALKAQQAQVKAEKSLIEAEKSLIEAEKSQMEAEKSLMEAEKSQMEAEKSQMEAERKVENERAAKEKAEAEIELLKQQIALLQQKK